MYTATQGLPKEEPYKKQTREPLAQTDHLNYSNGVMVDNLFP